MARISGYSSGIWEVYLKPCRTFMINFVLQKQFPAFSCQVFLTKSFFIDICQRSKYASAFLRSNANFGNDMINVNYFIKPLQAGFLLSLKKIIFYELFSRKIRFYLIIHNHISTYSFYDISHEFTCDFFPTLRNIKLLCHIKKTIAFPDFRKSTVVLSVKSSY